jgi:mRNA deadenylase 3'-5' endonuclease subunit Ccr4
MNVAQITACLLFVLVAVKFSMDSVTVTNGERIQITTWNILNPEFEHPKYYDESAHAHLHWTRGNQNTD